MIIFHLPIFFMWFLFRSFVHFLIGLLLFLLVSFKSSFDLFGYKSFIRFVFASTFSQSVAYHYIFLAESFTGQRILSLMSPFIICFLSWIELLMLYLKIITKPKVMYISYAFVNKSTVLNFTFNFIIHLELISV